ncbi:MAG: hypothetical protein ACTHJ9_05330 [Rhodanobacter sp.]
MDVLADEQIETALKAKLELDYTLRDLIRGDTVAIGYSKADVVRALLVALDVVPRAAGAELIDAAQGALYDMRQVRDHCTSLVAVGLDEQIKESIDRLAAALARAGDCA